MVFLYAQRFGVYQTPAGLCVLPVGATLTTVRAPLGAQVLSAGAELRHCACAVPPHLTGVSDLHMQVPLSSKDLRAEILPDVMPAHFPSGRNA